MSQLGEEARFKGVGRLGSVCGSPAPPHCPTSEAGDPPQIAGQERGFGILPYLPYLLLKKRIKEGVGGKGGVVVVAAGKFGNR